MPDFSRPKYVSYVQLCRELQLERKPQVGDYFEISDREPDGSVTIELNCLAGGWWERLTGFVVVWLPTLADWLEMLEAAGYDYVRFWPRANPRSWECEAQGVNAPIVTTAFSGGSVFESREEAAARLWMAVAKPSLRGHQLS